uniref:Taste receptor type 1 member 3 n=1 Tax=Salarias fasciatus TaxID=181472 RepID=A0A672FZU5_SALFA
MSLHTTVVILVNLIGIISLDVLSREWFSNVSTSLFRLPGDVMLGGLFPINILTSNLSERTVPNNITCDRLSEFGLGMALVMKYAVDEINANKAMLPGVKLGYEIYDTCRQSAVVVKPTLSFLTEKHKKALAVSCNYTDYETSISAIIGPYTSEMVSVIGKLMGFFLMPQISFGATSERFSDNHLYPSFFRTVPSDKWQVDVMGLLMKEFGWNWVAVVGSEEEYGQRGVQRFTKMAENISVCVAYQAFIPVYTDPEPAAKTIVENIITAKVGVVIVFAMTAPVKVLLTEAIRKNVTAVWVASTSWAVSTQITSIPNIETIGTIIAFTDKTSTLEEFTAYTEVLLEKMGRERPETAPPTPKTLDPSNPCPQCWNMSPANISLVTDPGVQRSAFSVYAAIYSVGQALHDLLNCNTTACDWGPNTKVLPWKLLEVLRKTSVNINGILLKFDESGNPNIGYNVIQWIWEPELHFRHVGTFMYELFLNKSKMSWHTADSQVPLSTCSAECESGQVRRVKGFHSCCFDCIDCLAGTYQANYEDIQCTPCPERQWSHLRSTNCTPPTFEFLSWGSSTALEMMLVGVLVLVCHGAVAVVFLRHRGTPLVTASGGVLGLVALLGLMGACFSLLLFLGRPGDVVCRLQLPFISIFQTVALSIVMSISLQILFVTEFPETAARHLPRIRGPFSWLFVLTCCAVQAGLCGWFVQNSVTLSQHVANMKIDFVSKFLPCPVSPLLGLALMQGFNGAMALISFMCTFMAVKPLHQYNLARDITFSTLIYCVVWVVFIPIYIGMKDQEKSVLHVYFTLAGIFGLMGAYYFPKCYFLLRKPDLNKPEHFCTFLEGAPPRPLEDEPQPQAQPEPQDQPGSQPETETEGQ